MRFKLILVHLLAAITLVHPQEIGPLDMAKKVAGRIIQEAPFELTETKQKSAVNLEVLVFNEAIKSGKSKSAFAFSKISVNDNVRLNFGISYSAPFRLWINGEKILESKRASKFHFKEIAYGLFVFMDSFVVDLVKGDNRIVVESELKGNPYIYIREITSSDESVKAKFIPVIREIQSTWAWIFIPAEKLTRISRDSYPQKSFLDSLYAGMIAKKGIIASPLVKNLKKLALKDASTFKKDSFADWNYPNGIMMMTLLNLSNYSGDFRFTQFVKKYCDFVYDNIPLFRKQYFADHDLRGSLHRIFRKSMLDDAGSPSFPFIQLAVEEKQKRHMPIVKEMIKYVSVEQMRLNDGTLCRPEPERFTVWADDLFMSVPLLLRAAKLSGSRKYYDDAVKQIINFNKYLFDDNKNLYKHGWFSRTQERSKVFWGRANGWIIWAESEALLYLPKSHPSYGLIEKIFSDHILGIVKLQDESGIWHQILDDSSSFGETSCTAMFITGLARGIVNGTLDASLSSSVFKAWKSILPNISPEGIVKDICCGTGIGYDDEFYKSRARLDNDPRGLGAVITAGIEVDRLKKYLAER
ncbi:MAG: glycoside hydrolase family 88 protein [Melioribacteraceae bacterium]